MPFSGLCSSADCVRNFVAPKICAQTKISTTMSVVADNEGGWQILSFWKQTHIAITHWQRCLSLCVRAPMCVHVCVCVCVLVKNRPKWEQRICSISTLIYIIFDVFNKTSIIVWENDVLFAIFISGRLVDFGSGIGMLMVCALCAFQSPSQAYFPGLIFCFVVRSVFFILFLFFFSISFSATALNFMSTHSESVKWLYHSVALSNIIQLRKVILLDLSIFSFPQR